MKVILGQPYSFRQLGKRVNQEDCRFPDADMPLHYAPFFLVCDGVGGCEKGGVASRLVCKAFAETLADVKWDDAFTIDKFKKALDNAFYRVEKASKDYGNNMATTLAFVCFHKEGCLAAHIGDSRIYHIRPNAGIMYRSDDHSLVNALVHSGYLTPDEAISHPDRNIITRSIGTRDDSEERARTTVMEISDLEVGDYFILCSDGVLEHLQDNVLVNILSDDTADSQKIKTIASICQKSNDNNTCYLIPIQGIENRREEHVELLDITDCTTAKLSRAPEQAKEVGTTSSKRSLIENALTSIKKLFQ